MTLRVGLILGGAECALEELDRARSLCSQVGAQTTVYVVNDWIAEYPDSVIAVTLHHHKVAGWLSQRGERRLPSLKQIWHHFMPVSPTPVTHTTTDWGGSVGLFATKIAIHGGENKILLCGVPMVANAGHHRRKRRWDACDIFKRHWYTQFKLTKPMVRSFSGWTAEMLGTPSAEFLLGPNLTKEEYRVNQSQGA